MLLVSVGEGEGDEEVFVRILKLCLSLHISLAQAGHMVSPKFKKAGIANPIVFTVRKIIRNIGGQC